MTYLSETLKFPTHLTDVQEQTSLENYSEQIASLLAQLPSNNLAVFGHEPVRSHPYPQWPISDERDIHALATVVRSDQWGGAPFPGPCTRTFATEFAAMQTGSNEVPAVPMANGSITLEVALRAAQIGWGDEVVVPAYTFQATAAAPIAAGAIPVLVDVDPDTYCISPAAIEAAITPQTQAIIPVHLGAQVADMDAIMAIANRHELVVIEDCAHAHGAQWNGQGVGTFGHFGSFSLQSSKILTVGEGGVLLCRTQTLAARATSIIDCGRLPTSEDLGELTASGLGAETGPMDIARLVRQLVAFNRQEPAFSLGTNYRMSEFQAAMGSVALTRFAQQVEERETMLAYLESRLGQVLGVRSLKHDPRHTKRSFYRYIFALVPEAFGASHDEVCWALRAEGIPCTVGYPALHRHSLFQPMRSRLPVPSVFPERFDYRALSLPEAEKACAQEAIWLDESVFRAGKTGVDDVVAALQKVQRNAPILNAAKAALLQVFPS